MTKKEEQRIKEEKLKLLGSIVKDIKANICKNMEKGSFEEISKGCKYAEVYDKTFMLCKKATYNQSRNQKGFAWFCRFSNCPFT